MIVSSRGDVVLKPGDMLLFTSSTSIYDNRTPLSWWRAFAGDIAIVLSGPVTSITFAENEDDTVDTITEQMIMLSGDTIIAWLTVDVQVPTWEVVE